jgi:hypothetical protein
VVFEIVIDTDLVAAFGGKIDGLDMGPSTLEAFGEVFQCPMDL